MGSTGLAGGRPELRECAYTLIILAIAVVLPRFEVSAESICPDHRERMECGEGSDVEQTDNLIVTIKLKFMELFDASAGLEKDKQTEVDALLERFKEINKTTCSMWNACLDKGIWHEFHNQFRQVLLQGEGIAKQKGADDQNVQEFINGMKDITEFYERGIDDHYKTLPPS